MEKKKPQIRFNGFTEDWEKKKLGELGKWYKGQPLSKSDIRECGTFPCIHYGELFSYTEIIREVTSRTNVKPSILSSGNDLLFPDSDVTPDGLGRCSSLTDKGVLLGAGINILQLESCVRAPFCSLCTNVHKEQIIERVTGTTVRHTKPSSLSEVVISISPSIPEQEKIGVFLTTLDKLIAKLEAKLDKLRKLKKALLEKMFINVNGGGYEAPQIRFKGYTDKWQVKELREVAMRVVSKNEDNRVTLPLTISAQYGLISQTDFFNNRIAAKDVRGYYVIRKGEFAYNRSTSEGSPFGAVKRLDRYNAGVLSTLYLVFRISSEMIDSNYLVCYFSTDNWHKHIEENAAEGARNHGLLNITSEDFFTTPIKAPMEKEEQSKVALSISTLEEALNKESTKLTKLRNIKQSLLQKMFA